MCFEHDYDWTASVSTDELIALEKPEQCYECFRVIQDGETAQHIYQQEYEECQCDSCQGDSGITVCEKADFGETFKCWICSDCCKILKAIEALEEREGCPPGARQPSYGGLFEEAFHQDPWEAHKYAKAAVEQFPELATHRFIVDHLESPDEE
jgi:hypothetical protein